MGYNLKTPWDLDELKKEGIPGFAPFVGPSSFGAHKTRGDCVVDLKLGRFGDPGEELVGKFKVPGASMMESSSCGSSRRARARGNGTQIASCLVDGCSSDLSVCRDYHRRHKVCEAHSKTPVVTIGGQEKRFCQQCSRFHSLVEFDEGKRSCRKRLDGHNRRRRKPQPEPGSLTPGRLLSNHQGARYLPFSSPQVCPTGSMVSSVWAGVVKAENVKAENDPIPYSDSHSLISFSDRKNSVPGILSHSYKGGKQIPFLLGTSSSLPEDSVSRPLLDPNSALGNGGSSQKMFVGLNRVVNSDRALSLLSSPPAKTREVALSHMVHLEPGHPSHSLIPTLHYNSLRSQVEPTGSVLVCDGSSSANHLNSEGMFHIALDGSSTSMPHQTLSFSWE